MKELFEKYLGWLGFVTWMACILLFALDKFMLKNTFPINEEFLMIGFLIMGAASTIQGIINNKYFTKYSDKFKNGIIVFIATTTIGISYFLIS